MKKLLAVVLIAVMILCMAPAALAEGDEFEIDGANIYDDLGMTNVYNAGVPFTEGGGAVAIALPFVNNSTNVAGNRMTVSLGFTNTSNTIPMPYVYNTYQAEVKQKTVSINGGSGTKDAYLVYFSIPLENEHYYGSYIVDVNLSWTDTAGNERGQSFPIKTEIVTGINPNPTASPTPEPTETPTPAPESSPKLIISEYKITPEKAMAGQNIDVAAKIKNTSKEQSVKNIVVKFGGETTDLMTEGDANTFYIDSIGAGETVDFDFTMFVRADATAKPQNITVDISYEDKNATALTAAGSILVDIIQPIRTKIEAKKAPTSVMVGDSAAFTLAFYNMGKTMLYNVTVELAGDGLTPEGSNYLGNLDSGTTKNADIYASVTGPEGTCNGKFIVSYEDGYGEKYSEELAFSTEIMPMQVYSDEPVIDEPVEEQTGTPWWIWIIIAAGGVVAAVLIVRGVKKSKQKREREELLDDEDDDDLN